jgi:ABC-type Mn2+/Zn2+ transport system permease subunit
VDTLANLDDARRGRLLAARSSLPRPLWFALITGAVMTIGFSYLFGVKNVIAHTVITVLLAASIGLGLFLIVALDGPFSGGLSISPEAFTAVLENWDRSSNP